MGIRLQLRVISRAAASFVPAIQPWQTSTYKPCVQQWANHRHFRGWVWETGRPKKGKRTDVHRSVPSSSGAGCRVGMIIPLGSEAVAGGVVPGPGRTVAPITPGDMAGLPP